jgi:hypothetical protein
MLPLTPQVKIKSPPLYPEILLQRRFKANTDYVLNQQGGGDMLTSSSGGSDSGTESIDGATVYDGSGTFTETGSGNDNSGMTQTDGWSLSEQGTMAAGSMSLASYVFSETEGDSASSADNNNWSETLSGTNEGQSFSGSDSGGESDSQGNSASGSLLEQGSASNGCLILSLVSYSGSGSEDGSASDQESGDWTGGYSGSDSAQASSGDNDNYSLSSFALTEQGSDTLTSSSVSNASATESGSSSGQEDFLGYVVYQGGGTFVATSGSNGSAQGTATDSWNLSEQGTFGNGSLSLSSYEFQEQQDSSSSVVSSGSWTETFAGSNQGESYSGGAGGSFGDTVTDSSNGSLSEQGVWANGMAHDNKSATQHRK